MLSPQVLLPIPRDARLVVDMQCVLEDPIAGSQLGACKLVDAVSEVPKTPRLHWIVENRETAYDSANVGIREMPE